MNKMKSILTLATLAVLAGTSVGCYTEHERHYHRVYEPAGANRYYYYGPRYYSPRYERHYYYEPAPRPPGLDLHIGPP
jgi:hypothetical protein